MLTNCDRMPASHTNGKLFILSGIQLNELRREKAVFSQGRRVQKLEHFLYERPLSPLSGQLRQLKLKQPLALAALELLNDLAQSGTSEARWTEYALCQRILCNCVFFNF